MMPSLWQRSKGKLPWRFRCPVQLLWHWNYFLAAAEAPGLHLRLQQQRPFEVVTTWSKLFCQETLGCKVQWSQPLHAVSSYAWGTGEERLRPAWGSASHRHQVPQSSVLSSPYLLCTFIYLINKHIKIMYRRATHSHTFHIFSPP